MNKNSFDYKTRKDKGQFFTEDILVTKLIEAFGLSFDNKTIVEPSCGAGAFIKQILSKTKNFKSIYGIDIDKKALRNILNLDSRICCLNKDFLKMKFDNKVDMVIGNPPFNLKSDKFVDSTEAFISNALDILKDDGELIFIIPNTVLRSQKYQNIRKKILDTTTIIGIIDTRKYEFFGADIETVAIYLKKKTAITQKYFYLSSNQKRTINLERNVRDTILLYNRKYFNIINNKIYGTTLNDLFYIKRGNCVNTGLKGRDLDFYDDICLMPSGNDCFIAIQNIAYRITANVVKGDINKISDTITMLIPKKKMTIKKLLYITNYLNSSIAFYNLHINCLNNSRLTIHMDKYYIDDLKISLVSSETVNDLENKLKQYKKTKDITQIRNEYFYDLFNFDRKIINEIESIWIAPKFKLKEGINHVI